MPKIKFPLNSNKVSLCDLLQIEHNNICGCVDLINYSLKGMSF